MRCQALRVLTPNGFLQACICRATRMRLCCLTMTRPSQLASTRRCKQALIDRLAGLRLRIHEAQTQVLPTHCGIPWLGFVVYPQRRRLKRRNAVNFTRRLVRNIDAYQAGHISFAELDASVQGWINHVRYADTWRLREHLFAAHPIRGGVGCGGC